MGQVENILGTLLIGIFFNTYLYGLASFQYLLYFSSKIIDTVPMKIVVTLLFANDTFQSALMLFMGWEYCVRNYINPLFLDGITWPYAYIPIGTAVTAAATHFALASRIYFMSKRKWVFVLLLSASLGSLATGLAFGIVELSSKNARRTDSLFKILAAWWLGIQVVLNMLLAVLSALSLHNHRTAGDQKTNGVIDRLVRGAIHAGAAPALFGAASLATFFAFPKTDLFVMFIIPLGRIYTTSFMNGLNVREELKERLLGSQELVNAVVTDVIFHQALATPTFSLTPVRPGTAGSWQPQRHRQVSSKGSKASLQIVNPIIVHSPKSYQNLWDGERQ